jgi:predicted transcriptional regulator
MKNQTIDKKEFKNRRINLNISQKDFSQIAGVSYRTILRFERGKPISERSVHKIVQALKTIESSPKNENIWWKTHKNSLLKTEEE